MLPMKIVAVLGDHDSRTLIAIVDGAANLEEVAAKTGLDKFAAARSVRRLRADGLVSATFEATVAIAPTWRAANDPTVDCCGRDAANCDCPTTTTDREV